MAVRIKELVIRYEDDGSMSPLSAAEHKEKYRPLTLNVHHHCAPPPLSPANPTEEASSAKEYTIDLSQLSDSTKE